MAKQRAGKRLVYRLAIEGFRIRRLAWGMNWILFTSSQCPLPQTVVLAQMFCSGLVFSF